MAGADFRSNRSGEIEDHLTIDVIPPEEGEGNLVVSIKERMENVSILGTICRVPDKLVKGNEQKFYHPRLVTIGPLHHNSQINVITDHNNNNNNNNDLKWRYLNTLLSRKPGLEQTLDACVKCLKILEQKARKCYKENLDHISSNELVQMMLVDGCFIIELFLEYANKIFRRRDDPFFTRTDQFFNLKCDLILLENQIPFFVLQHLFHLVPIPKQCNQTLLELALFFFRKWIPGKDGQYFQEKFAPNVHHLLDLIRQCHIPPILQQADIKLQTHFLHLPNASKLKARGISFYESTTETLLNIKFDDEKGILEIPSLIIHKYKQTLFKNLIAFEILCCCSSSSSCTSPKHITSYLFLMKQLIKNENDVKMFQNRQIIISGLEKQGEIMEWFNGFDHLLMNVVEFEDFYYYYAWICEKIEKYEEIKMEKWRWCRKIKHFYGKTPFGVAGLSFAILVVVSIFTAVLFTVLELFLHHVD